MHSELDIDSVVRTAVADIRRRYDGIPAGDLYQECWSWVVSNPGKMDRYQAMPNTSNAAFFLRIDLRSMLGKLCRKEKAYQEGFEVADNYTYSTQGLELRGLLAECLRAIVTGTREPVRVESEGRSNTDPSEASNSFLVSMLDVERGWELLGEEDKRLLAAFFVYDVGVSALAEEYGLSDRQVYNRLKTALRRLVGPLNGEL